MLSPDIDSKNLSQSYEFYKSPLDSGKIDAIESNAFMVSDIDINIDEISSVCHFISSKNARNLIEVLVISKSTATTSRNRREAVNISKGYSSLHAEGSKLLFSIIEFISKSKKLHSLIFDGITLSSDSLVHIGAAMSASSSDLRWLSFKDCPIGDNGIRALTPHLGKLRIRALFFENCNLSDSCCTYFANIIKAQESFQNTLQWNASLRASELEEGENAHKLLPTTPDTQESQLFVGGLVLLDLSRNLLTSKGIIVLANQIKRCKWMLALNISSNQIDDIGLTTMITAITENPTVVSLLLSNNPGYTPSLLRGILRATASIEFSSLQERFRRLTPDIARVIESWINLQTAAAKLSMLGNQATSSTDTSTPASTVPLKSSLSTSHLSSSSSSPSSKRNSSHNRFNTSPNSKTETFLKLNRSVKWGLGSIQKFINPMDNINIEGSTRTRNTSKVKSDAQTSSSSTASTDHLIKNNNRGLTNTSKFGRNIYSDFIDIEEDELKVEEEFDEEDEQQKLENVHERSLNKFNTNESSKNYQLHHSHSAATASKAQTSSVSSTPSSLQDITATSSPLIEIQTNKGKLKLENINSKKFNTVEPFTGNEDAALHPVQKAVKSRDKTPYQARNLIINEEILSKSHKKHSPSLEQDRLWQLQKQFEVEQELDRYQENIRERLELDKAQRHRDNQLKIPKKVNSREVNFRGRPVDYHSDGTSPFSTTMERARAVSPSSLSKTIRRSKSPMSSDKKRPSSAGIGKSVYYNEKMNEILTSPYKNKTETNSVNYRQAWKSTSSPTKSRADDFNTSLNKSTTERNRSFSARRGKSEPGRTSVSDSIDRTSSSCHRDSSVKRWASPGYLAETESFQNKTNREDVIQWQRYIHRLAEERVPIVTSKSFTSATRSQSRSSRQSTGSAATAAEGRTSKPSATISGRSSRRLSDSSFSKPSSLTQSELKHSSSEAKHSATRSTTPLRQSPGQLRDLPRTNNNNRQSTHTPVTSINIKKSQVVSQEMMGGEAVTLERLSLAVLSVFEDLREVSSGLRVIKDVLNDSVQKQLNISSTSTSSIRDSPITQLTPTTTTTTASTNPTAIEQHTPAIQERLSNSELKIEADVPEEHQVAVVASTQKTKTPSESKSKTTSVTAASKASLSSTNIIQYTDTENEIDSDNSTTSSDKLTSRIRDMLKSRLYSLLGEFDEKNNNSDDNNNDNNNNSNSRHIENDNDENN